MSHTGQAKLRHNLPDLTENAKTMTGAQLARHYGIGHQAISRHLKRAGLTAQRHAPVTNIEDMPDIMEKAKVLHLAALARHYGLTAKKMAYRVKVLGIKPAPKPAQFGTTKSVADDKYADLAERAKEMHARALARHYGVTAPTITKTLRKRGIVAAPPPKYIPRPNAKRTLPYKFIPRATPFTDTRIKTHADLAAEFLQRECAVYHCDEDGRANPKGKFYRRGRAVLTPDEVIARAVAKGWRANAWMECAA